MRLSVYGVVLILTIALSNTSCCSQKKVVSEKREAVTEMVEASEQTRSQSEAQHASVLTVRKQSEGVTETEIEVYESEPDTVSPPRLKARIRQRHSESGTEESRASEAGQSSTATEAENAATYQGGTLDEVTVTGTKSPSLWERMKQGAAWAAAIVIAACAGWIIYKLKKGKTI